MMPFETTIDLLGRIEASTLRDDEVGLADGLSQAVSILIERAGGSQFLFIGNGASQSIASHMAADFLKNARVRSMAFTDSSLLTCVGNDLGFEELFAEPIRRFGALGDVLVAISSSGCSANILAGVAAARECGMTVITLSGFDADNPLRRSGDFNFWVPSHHYGDVEVVHSAVCHRMLDDFIANRG